MLNVSFYIFTSEILIIFVCRQQENLVPAEENLVPEKENFVPAEENLSILYGKTGLKIKIFDTLIWYGFRILLYNFAIKN